ncbi:glycosyltransferase family 4 protein [Patescibacteria group bacterium]
MKVLFVSALLPFPLYSGGQIRIYNLLKNLSKTNSITLLSFIRKKEENKYIENLDFLENVITVERGKATRLKYIVNTLLGPYPLLLSSYFNPDMMEIIQTQMQRVKYDLVHIEPFYVYPSLPKLNIPLVVSEHNVEHEVYESYASNSSNLLVKYVLKKDANRIKKWEKKVLKAADEIVCVSTIDQKKLINFSDRKSVELVPNGVDIDHFQFEEKDFTKNEKTFLYVGNFAWLPNKNSLDLLLNRTWPKIVSSHPQSKLNIVGKNLPKKYLKNKKYSNIEFFQNVNDIRKQYSKCDALLAPIDISGGTKFKLLESMAAGLPVVTTKHGASGLPVKSGIHCIIAPTQADFLEGVKSLFTNTSRWQKICKNAREFVENKYSWKNISSLQQKVWEKVNYEKR